MMHIMTSKVFHALSVLTEAIDAAGNRTDDNPEHDAKVAMLLDENQTTLRELVRYAARRISDDK